MTGWLYGWMHPTGVHTWRWRLLFVWILVFSAVAGALFNEHRSQTRAAEHLAEEAKSQNARQQATLIQVCDRGYILLGLIEAATEATRVQLRDDIRTGRPKTAAADVKFIRQFQSYHAEIVDQLTDKDSPCVKAAR